jgi:hypothetical protein
LVAPSPRTTPTGAGSAAPPPLPKPKQGLFVTGDKELDRILATFEQKEVAKAVRKATRATVKNYVLPEYRRRIAELGFEETDATTDAMKVRAVKRSRVRSGTELRANRNVAVQKRRSRGGRIGKEKNGKDFFQPRAIEFGDENDPPERPMFKALKSNAQHAIAEFRKHLRIAINEVAARAKAKG